jgi:soluble lytic murein transglycosylase-like protein
MTIKLLLQASAALAWMTCAQAREVSLATFAPPGSATETRFAQDKAMGQALRSHLESLETPAILAENPRAMPRSAPPAAGALRFPCLPARYAEVWWLPREVALRRSAHFEAMAAIACETGLPANLLDAVITQESGYRHLAVSSAGAMGMMQIMPGTARALGLAQPFDPVANMRAGARYLRRQIDRFGRIDLALAAYNAGPERRSLRAGAIPAFAETRTYVRTILTNWDRLIDLNRPRTADLDRGELAMKAVWSTGYRDVELIRYSR